MHSVIREFTDYNKGRFFGVEVVESTHVRRYTLTLTDVFGTPLERDQNVLYARESCGNTVLFKGKILGIADDGSVFLQWGESKSSTIAKFSEKYNNDFTGEARYEQLYVVPDESTEKRLG